MEKEKSNARRDRISIAEKINDGQLVGKPSASNQVSEENLRKSSVITGKISPLKWKAPSKGIAGLL
ncbi:hypothetical protein [Pedobacter sp. Leaf194]|uniref:hypothetical protein n=1 Tax=Pedobacter sp. Leaf194 TaxID=1736297 RepID=UPI000703B2EB|nr:hypothetical protein [Pedobacter sp. Leaf194]KQS32473.1 hypothetical protein ASG14_16440 [Pedobacter sp. Leaf194]